MTEKHPGSDDSHRVGGLQSRWERRKFLAIGGGVGATLFAGCTSDGGPGDDPDDGSDDGSDDTDGESNFRLLVSDRPADIGDFDSLEVTFDSARVFQGGNGEEDDEAEDDAETEEDPESEDDGDEAGSQGDAQETETPEEPGETEEADDEGETESATETGDGDGDDGSPETESEDGEEAESEDGEEAESEDGEEDDADDGESRGYVVFDLDDPTVDLTEVVGEKAMAVTEGHLGEGTYQKMELHVSDVTGIVGGEEAEVKVPSEKLQLTKPFEIAADETIDFVFDINVVKRGNEESYNLKPVITKSGVVGTDVDEHEEVDEAGEDEDEEETETAEPTETAEATETTEPTETVEPTETAEATETADD